jgi:hypothetical protein
MSICCFPSLCKSSTKVKNRSQEVTINVETCHKKLSPIKRNPQVGNSRIILKIKKNLKESPSEKPSNERYPKSKSTQKAIRFFPSSSKKNPNFLLNLSSISKHSFEASSNFDILNEIKLLEGPENETGAGLSTFKRNIRKFNEFTNRKRLKVQFFKS